MKKKLIKIILIIIVASVLICILCQKDNDDLSSEELYDYNQNYNDNDYITKFLDKGTIKILDNAVTFIADKSADSPEDAKKIVLEENSEINEDKIIMDLKVEYENKYAYVVTFIEQWEDFEYVEGKDDMQKVLKKSDYAYAYIVFKKQYFDVEQEIIYTKSKKDIYNILNLYYWNTWSMFYNFKMLDSEISKTKGGYTYSYYYINDVDHHEHIWVGPIDDIKEIHELRYCKRSIYIETGKTIDMDGEYYELKVLNKKHN